MTATTAPSSAPYSPSDSPSLLVDGAWVPATGSRDIEIVDPSTEEVVARVRESSPDDVTAAVRSARRAFDDGPWPRMSPDERADVITELAARLAARGEELAGATTTEMGMPISMSRMIQPAVQDVFSFYADLIRSYEFSADRARLDGATTRVVREPVGPTAAIVPFNGAYPTACLKLAAAMAAGCTTVIKPAPDTPLAVNVMADVIAELSSDGVLPPGVANMVVGDRETSEALTSAPEIDKVTFTGSTGVAKQIVSTVGNRIGRVTLELGGKSAAIVLDDAELDAFVPQMVMGGMINTGQACYGLTRVLVPHRRRDELVDAMRAVIGGLVVGDPHDPSTVIGPLSAARHRDRTERYVSIGIDEGAQVAIGGKRPEYLARGFFYEPTVLVDVDNSMRVAREEIFGPVVSVIGYSDVEEAIAIANDTDYGLGGAVFGADSERALSVAGRIRTGTMHVNCFVGQHITTPFGGYKQSGVGREGGPEGLEDFLEIKSIHLPA